MSLRLSAELTGRLEACAALLKIKKHTLAQLAIEAAVEAAEREKGLVVPVEFRLTPARVPIPSSSAKSPTDQLKEILLESIAAKKKSVPPA